MRAFKNRVQRALLLSIFLTAGLPFSAVAGDPSPDLPRKLVVYPLGDSITRGIDNIGYRQFLLERLDDAQIDARFVGSLSNGPSDFAEPHHEGHNGWKIADLDSQIDGWLKKFDPDVILLMAGANDIEGRFSDLKVIPARMERLITDIVSRRPRAILLVSEVSAIDNDKFDADAVAFNETLKTIVESHAAAGQRVVFVPMHDVVARAELIRLDHPNPFGNKKMADRWFEFILRAIRPAPSTPAPSVASER